MHTLIELKASKGTLTRFINKADVNIKMKLFEGINFKVVDTLNYNFSVLIGSVFGVSIGLIISVLQENFQFISMEGNFHIDYYPIQIKFTDIIFVFIAVFFIGLLASYYPVRALSKKFVVK